MILQIMIAFYGSIAVGVGINEGEIRNHNRRRRCCCGDERKEEKFIETISCFYHQIFKYAHWMREKLISTEVKNEERKPWSRMFRQF